PAVIDDRQPVAQGVGLLQVVRRQEHGYATLAQAPDLVPEPRAAMRVEAPGGSSRNTSRGPGPPTTAEATPRPLPPAEAPEGRSAHAWISSRVMSSAARRRASPAVMP